jgi:hypothetical protein
VSFISDPPKPIDLEDARRNRAAKQGEPPALFPPVSALLEVSRMVADGSLLPSEVIIITREQLQDSSGATKLRVFTGGILPDRHVYIGILDDAQDLLRQQGRRAP